MLFLTFFGEPRDHHIYEHAHHEHLGWNSNIPLLILAFFTLGLFYSGSLTGQGEVNLFGQKYEWFQTLIHKPSIESLHHFSEYKSEEFGTTDTREKLELPKATYDEAHGLREEEAHHVHKIHKIGALLSILIAFSGIFLAFKMYVQKSLSPDWWTSTFFEFTKTLKKKYYFDDFYNGTLIKGILLPFTNVLSWFDMGIYDKYAVDGWEKVNRMAFKFSRWFDDTIVDSGMVDGTGASVRLMNVIMRTVQSGKIQLYFVVLIVVLASYVWSLSF